MLTLRFTLTRGEVSSCYRRVQLRRRSIWAMISVGMALVVVGIWTSHAVLGAIGVGYAAGWAAHAWVLWPRALWRRHEQLRAEQVVSLSDEGVTLGMVNARTTSDWSSWSEVRLLGDTYVLRAKRRGFCLIPRRAFASEPEERLFRTLATRGTGMTLK